MRQTFCAVLLALCAATASAQDVKAVYHVNTGLDSAARILGNITNHVNADPQARIVVVTHGAGVDFLLSDAKDAQGREFSGQVSALASRGVEFRACGNTLQARKIDVGRLLMEAKVVPSGVAEVARLQGREGYAYLKP
ncbi:DsrE family protein [Alicycliphilus sp. T452]